MKKIAKFAMTASALVVSFSAAAAFTGTMSMGQVGSEIQSRLAQGASLALIARDARVAGIPASIATISMMSQGQDACNVVGGAVSGGYDAKAVLNAAVSAGANYNAMFTCAVNAGADPTTLVAPTAAGGDAGGTGAGGGFGAFGSTPTATFGGGGGGVRASGS